MQKKQYLSMTYLIFVALLIGMAILISKPSKREYTDEIITYKAHGTGNLNTSQMKNANGSTNSKIVNEKYKKVYFLTDEGLFSYNPNSTDLETTFTGSGTYSNLFLTDDGRYIAFCYAPREKNSNLTIIDCSDNTIIVKNNIDMHGNPIVKESKTYGYNYEFLKWENNKRCKLLQSVISEPGHIKIKENIIDYCINGK